MPLSNSNCPAVQVIGGSVTQSTHFHHMSPVGYGYGYPPTAMNYPPAPPQPFAPQSMYGESSQQYMYGHSIYGLGMPNHNPNPYPNPNPNSNAPYFQTMNPSSQQPQTHQSLPWAGW